MIIKELNTLDEVTIRDLKKLVEQCNQEDGLKGMLSMDTSFTFNPDMNTVFLMYDQESLVSALTIFAPGQNEGEITAMTLPEYRGKGYFTQLVKRAEAELKSFGVDDLLFVCEENSPRGKAAVAAQKAQHDFTEYLLKYNHSLDQLLAEYDFKLKLKTARDEDLESIIKISMSTFGDSYEGAKLLAIGILKAENRRLFLGQLEGEVIGMGAFALNDGEASIHGLGVLPGFQGKGYGKELLYGIIKKLLEINVEAISIDVDSQNLNAFQLYKNSGFEIESAWEYHRRAIQ